MEQNDDIFAEDLIDATTSALNTENIEIGSGGGENPYIETKERALELLRTPKDCEMAGTTPEGPIFEGICEYTFTDQGDRESETLIKIHGRMIYEGLSIKVVDPTTGLKALIYTKGLDQAAPPEGGYLDRKLFLGGVEIRPRDAMITYMENDQENPEGISVYVMQGKGELEVLTEDTSIGKILSPGLNQQDPINTANINIDGRFVSQFATMTKDGLFILRPENISEDVLEQAEEIELQSRQADHPSCLASILNNPTPLSSTEAILALIALSIIITKLQK